MGCSDGDDDADDGQTIDLPAITEPATGRGTIEYTDVSVTGLTGTVAAYMDTSNGYTFSVTDGKMTLTLNTPSSTQSVNQSTLLQGDMARIFGPEGALTITGTANFTAVFSFRDQSNNVRVERSKAETDDVTYYNESAIYYFYVSANVTISQAAYTYNGTDSDGSSYVNRYGAISLALMTGWNLVQLDQYSTVAENTLSAKIADQDVPWKLGS
jgi:hypothetical protein